MTCFRKLAKASSPPFSRTAQPPRLEKLFINSYPGGHPIGRFDPVSSHSQLDKKQIPTEAARSGDA